MEKRTNVWLVSGPPAIGKSTLVSKVVFNLRSRGVIVGGFVTTEKRVNGQRVGFRIANLLTGSEGDLASVRGKLGPRVGRYRVNLSDLSSVGGQALLEASRAAEVIAIDEVGPMELTSPEFRRALESCIASKKPILAIVHERMNDPIIEALKALSSESVYLVNLDNRDSLANEITRRISSELGSSGTL